MRVFVFISAALAACVVHAQAYPVKPIRLLVPFGPGGVGDITSRAVMQKMSEAMNQQIIIVGGTLLCSWTAKCAGNAQSKRNHQDRMGVSSNAASNIELGGHIKETERGGRVSAKPFFAPR